MNYELGYEEALPDYVDDVLLARWIGVPVWELESVPYWYIEQARVVRAAEFKARTEVQERRK